MDHLTPQQRHKNMAAIRDGVEGSTENDIDTKALDSYFTHVYNKEIDDFKMPRRNVLRNAHIIDDMGRLTIAGLMFFAKEPQQYRPQHCIKAVWFYGNEISGTKYRDSRDITGTIPEMYEEAMRWVKSCLHRPQNDQSFNSVGELEIPEVVLEELIQNALVHLDLLKPAAIRLLVFGNRVEIINPGSLPDGQTIEEILLGNSDPRNMLLAQFGSNTMPYRGLGSGIPRVMASGSDVELIDRPDGNQFIARIWRATQKDDSTTQKANENLIDTTQKDETTTQKPLNTTQKRILEYLKNYPKATRQDVAEQTRDWYLFRPNNPGYDRYQSPCRHSPCRTFLLKRGIDLSLLRQGFHIPPEFHAPVYAALGRELHHGEGCDVQLMVEALTDSVNPTDDIKKKWSVTKNLRKGGDKSSLPFTFRCKLRQGKLSAVKCFLRIIRELCMGAKNNMKKRVKMFV